MESVTARRHVLIDKLRAGGLKDGEYTRICYELANLERQQEKMSETELQADYELADLEYQLYERYGTTQPTSIAGWWIRD